MHASGPTFFLLTGKQKNALYTDEFLLNHGAVRYSTVIMTPSGFLTDEAWQQIVPLLIKGVRWKVSIQAGRLGIDEETCDKLLIGMTFDGFKSHLKNLNELAAFAENNVLCAVEDRDSSEINQTSCMKCMMSLAILYNIIYNIV